MIARCEIERVRELCAPDALEHRLEALGARLQQVLVGRAAVLLCKVECHPEEEWAQGLVWAEGLGWAQGLVWAQGVGPRYLCCSGRSLVPSG